MLLIIVVILITFVYWYTTKKLSYWEDRGVPYKKCSFFNGIHRKTFNIKEISDEYNKFPNERYYGTYKIGRPILVIRDNDLIRKISVKWFEAFADHRTMAPSFADPIWAKNVFSTRVSEGWHDLRSSLSPLFSSGKLKTMFELMQKCAKDCVEHYHKQGNPVTTEAKDMFRRTTVNVIASTIYGINCNSYEQPENEFYRMAIKMTDFSGLKIFKFLGYTLIPRIMQLFDIRLFEKDVVQFFSDVVSESMKLRRENKLIRSDMIQLFIKAQKGQLTDDSQSNINYGFSAVDESEAIKTGKKKFNLSDDDIKGVATGFFLAGFDTTSNLMCFAAYELATNPDKQEKLFEEVSTVPRDDNGNITYRDLMEMKYLDMVVSETFRLWPIGDYLERECTIPFTIEPEREHERPLFIEKGIQCQFPVIGFHRNPIYYPNPEKFDPERFSEKNKGNIKPLTYIPFGVGLRNCIGSRFALLEIKTLLAELVTEFEIGLSSKTQTPLKLVIKGLSYYPEGGIWLTLKPRNATV